MRMKQEAIRKCLVVLLVLCMLIPAAAIYYYERGDNHQSSSHKQGTAQTTPVIEYSAESRTQTATVTVTNAKGFIYEYQLFRQNGAYGDLSGYLKEHGCSTCVLATVLGALCPELSGITPDYVIDTVEPTIFEEKELQRNYRKKLKGQMPLTLTGIKAVLDSYGIESIVPVDSRVTDASVSEVEEHLRAGNPVIVTFGSGREYNLSSGVHTILLMGIDKNGYVYIGDSVWKKKKDWGSMGLIKGERLTVKQILSCINGENWNINKRTGSIFYNNNKDQGYLMIQSRDK